MLHGQDLGSLLGGKLEKACLEISGLRLGTGSPTPMMETPMGNQTFNSGLCAGTESELELLPTYVTIEQFLPQKKPRHYEHVVLNVVDS